jgi:hypothetical protein
MKLEPEATKTPEIKPFDIINDEQQKEKHAANHFFSSLLGIDSRDPLTAYNENGIIVHPLPPLTGRFVGRRVPFS